MNDNVADEISEYNLRAVEHVRAEHLVGMVVERSQETDANLGEIFEVRIRDLTSRPVVLDQILTQHTITQDAEKRKRKMK